VHGRPEAVVRRPVAPHQRLDRVAEQGRRRVCCEDDHRDLQVAAPDREDEPDREPDEARASDLGEKREDGVERPDPVVDDPAFEVTVDRDTGY
jgi:hypothetical protein